MILPIISTHFSLGKSILTLDKPEEQIANNIPTSIFSIAKAHDLKELYVVDNSMSGFLQLIKQAKLSEVNVRFGLKLVVCENLEDKSEESFKTEHKIIVWLKSGLGYPALCKLATKAQTDGFYYIPRIDSHWLDELLTNDLSISIPFYDSFLFNNLMYFNTCIFNYEKYKPTFFRERSELPFDYIIQNALEALKVPIQDTRTVYYYKKEDFKTYMTLKCISKRKILDMPNFDHLSSDCFSFEEYLKQRDSK